MLDFFINSINLLAACGPFNEKEFNLISSAYKVFLVITPAVVLALCTVDIAKAVIAQDDNAVKKAQNNAIKRIIAGVVVFFVPIIINLFLGMKYTVEEKQSNGKVVTKKIDLGSKCVISANK